MQTGLKWVLGGSVILLLVVGGESLYLYRRNRADEAAPVKQASTYKADPDDDVFLKHEHPMSLKDEKDLKGRTLWMSAGGQMDYYPYNGHTVGYEHSQGVLLGAEKILVKDAVEQTAPKKATFRIPSGDKQVLLLFTLPDDHANPDKLYAVPVGDREDGSYNFSTDEIFFYDDPHQLFSYWGPEKWKAIDAHQATLGMNERQVMMALGQVSVDHGDKIGDRSVEFDNQGHPKVITFEDGKATKIVDEKQ